MSPKQNFTSQLHPSLCQCRKSFSIQVTERESKSKSVESQYKSGRKFRVPIFLSMLLQQSCQYQLTSVGLGLTIRNVFRVAIDAPPAQESKTASKAASLIAAPCLEIRDPSAALSSTPPTGFPVFVSVGHPRNLALRILTLKALRGSHMGGSWTETSRILADGRFFQSATVSASSDSNQNGLNISQLMPSLLLRGRQKPERINRAESAETQMSGLIVHIL
jgi:hypothetical protein